MKVDFFIIGTQKSGTTNLAYLLSKSLHIITHPQLECTFFYNDNEYQKGLKYLQKTYFYHHKKITKSPTYYLLKSGAAYTHIDSIKRALDHNPDMKFLMIFRNPINRFISSYYMECARNVYHNTLEKTIDIALNNPASIEHKIFYRLGLYDYWLKQILPIIPIASREIFIFEDLYTNKEAHLLDFAKKYNLELSASAINGHEIKNSAKSFNNKGYQKLIVKLKNSIARPIIKSILPVPLWVNLTQVIENSNLIEPQDTPIVDENLKDRLREAYAQSILNFEKIIGVKTNWLNG